MCAYKCYYNGVERKGALKMKNLKNCKTYIISDKYLHGGRSYREYTWEQVLEYFEAPNDIDSIDDLVDWIEKHDGIACQYLIEEWQEYDENGLIK